MSVNSASMQDSVCWTTASVEMKSALQETDIVAVSDYSVIIYGPSGSGKELLAKRIHEKSARKNNPFVAVDCGTLTRELAGSTFFGHTNGAFTGAIEDRCGCFEQADGGTLFLDEVANLSLDIQIFLLRAIQERKFRKIGASVHQSFNVRIIVASNVHLIDAVKKGLFREDLFHRLNEFNIKLPGLETRKQDILSLCKHFISESCTELGKPILHLSPMVEKVLLGYNWPGNIRELRNIIRRCCLLCVANEIQIEQIPAEFDKQENLPLEAEPKPILVALVTPDQQHLFNLKLIASKQERAMIIEVIIQTNFNKTRAARILNIDRKTLYNKLHHLKIDTALLSKPCQN